jgi:hypothetical protein
MLPAIPLPLTNVKKFFILISLPARVPENLLTQVDGSEIPL